MFLVDWPGGDWQATATGVAVILVTFFAVLWLALVFWSYRDIRQRTRDPIVQTVAVLLVLLIPFAGHWIYLILRPRYTLTELYERSLEEEALLQELEDQKACPTCRRRVLDDYLICPSCRTQLKEPCRSCQRPLSYSWVACPYCAFEKPAREGYGPRPARSLPRTGPPGRIQEERRPQPVARASTVPNASRQAPARDPFATSRPPRPRGDDAPVIDATAD